MRFIYVTFNNSGELLSAINYQGILLFLDLSSSKFWIVYQTDCNILKFSPLSENEVIIGTIGGDILIMDINNGNVVDKLISHKYSVNHLSFSKDNLCVSCTKYEAIIWNLNTKSKIQVLNVTYNISLKYVRIYS